MIHIRPKFTCPAPILHWSWPSNRKLKIMFAHLPFCMFKEDITENVACFSHSLASFQNLKLCVAAVAPSSRVPASAMSAMLFLLVVVTYKVRICGGFEKHNIHSQFRENQPTGSKVVFMKVSALHVALRFLATSSPCRLSFCLLLRQKEAHFCDL
jgi:hypothetical protein